MRSFSVTDDEDTRRPEVTAKTRRPYRVGYRIQASNADAALDRVPAGTRARSSRSVSDGGVRGERRPCIGSAPGVPPRGLTP